jgi:subtilase family serine protease
VKDTTRNVGTGAAVASTTSFFLSTNATLDGGDTLLGSRAVSALAAGTEQTGSTTFTIPVVAPGKYFLIAKADNGGVVAESDETNNTKNKNLFVGPDLTIKSISGPGSAARNTSVSITVVTRNAGGAPTPASVTRIHLSTDKKVNAGDDVLGNINVPALAVNATHSATVVVTIPAGTATGARFFLAQADATNASTESRETNNVKSTPVSITP